MIAAHYEFLKPSLPPKVTEAAEIRREKAINNSATLGVFRRLSAEESFWSWSG